MKWIPCSERMPKNYKYVLVCGLNRTIGIWMHCNNNLWKNTEGYHCMDYEIIAWMPLPEPYKEDI